MMRRKLLPSRYCHKVSVEITNSRLPCILKMSKLVYIPEKPYAFKATTAPQTLQAFFLDNPPGRNRMVSVLLDENDSEFLAVCEEKKIPHIKMSLKGLGIQNCPSPDKYQFFLAFAIVDWKRTPYDEVSKHKPPEVDIQKMLFALNTLFYEVVVVKFDGHPPEVKKYAIWHIINQGVERLTTQLLFGQPLAIW